MNDIRFPLASALTDILEPQIKQLQNGEYPAILQQVTPITADLLRYWFLPDHMQRRQINFHEGQRAAILAVIYAQEVLHCPSLQTLYEELAPQKMLELMDDLTKTRSQYPKYCAKMATGTGKTWVLNALLTWQYLNAVEYPQDERFTKNFLIVAPGLIVYDRLLDSFRGKLRSGLRHFETSDIHVFRDLFVPPTYRDKIFNFLQNKVCEKQDIGRYSEGFVAVTNWHLLAGEEDTNFVPEYETAGLQREAHEIVREVLPLKPGKAAGNSLDMLNRRYERGGALEFLKSLPSLMVFNDEAHHIHDVKTKEEESEVEWQRSLNEIAAPKKHCFIQIDFTATPYNQVGSGRRKRKKYFSHIVVDFDLNDAMNHRLVKALALDKRREIGAIENVDLDFEAERDERGQVSGLSEGQRIMLRAGLERLRTLEKQFTELRDDKHPKMMVMCEDTKVTPFVVEFLRDEGLNEDDVLSIDSNRKNEVKPAEWTILREQLFNMDASKEPRVVVSVLMLREGFDVNNICVIVPLRASSADILLEQTIGRGLRLMWREDESIQEAKRETRERIRKGLEPKNYFDVLFIVEHPRFMQFYDDLMNEGLVAGITDAGSATSAKGDVEKVLLREGYEKFDFAVPYIIHEAEEKLKSPTISPLQLEPFTKLSLTFLKQQLGKGDIFVAEDVQSKTQFGDYRIPGGEFNATSYNEYLGRVTRRISAALNRRIDNRAKNYRNMRGVDSNFPFVQAQDHLIAAWIDQYIHERMFLEEFTPTSDENWRILLLQEVTEHIVSIFAKKLVEIEENQLTGTAEVHYQKLSQVPAIRVRASSCVEVSKCIYSKLPYPSRGGGLEKDFMEWMDRDASVLAFCKIHEYDHSFLQLNYLKDNGMPGRYSPDFLIRTAKGIYLTETKSQTGLSDKNVQRKSRSAVTWCERINDLPSIQRDGRKWHYALIGEGTVYNWQRRNGKLDEMLEYATLRDIQRQQGKLEI